MQSAATRDRSSLLRRSLEAPAPSAGRILALHSNGGDADELVPLCRWALPRLDLCAAQAPCSGNPLLSSGNGGGKWAPYTGYGWYRLDAEGEPEPTSFADALGAVERLALELRERPGPLHLLGYREGGTLALGLAALTPELFDSVVALAAELPRVLCGKAVGRPPPILLVHGAGARPAGTVQTFSARGRSPETDEVRGAEERPIELVPQLWDWLERSVRPAEGGSRGARRFHGSH